MSNLSAQITREYELEQGSERKAVNADDIPISYEAITSEWLTHILCRGQPEARVITHRLDTPDEGMTNRRRIFLSYNEAGTGAGLPTSVFCKASHQLTNRLLCANCGLVQGEVLFYNKYRTLLDIEAPTSYLATYSPRTYNSIIVLDDLARHGAEFCKHTTEITRQRAESQMTLLAKMHGRFYASPELNNPDLPTFEDIFHNVDACFDLENFCNKGFLDGESAIPPKLFRRHAEIWPATRKSVALHGTLPRTFTHNDVHLRNWYIAPDGQMVLGDWQCFAKAHWGRDLAYTLSTSLSVENRRMWEKELIRFYLDRLRTEGGPVVAFDEAWKYYRQHLFSSLTWWTSTLALVMTQPRDATLEFIGRITTAMDDLDALSSFD